jgi:hypothetical protein
MTQEHEFTTDITLTESFWRETHPDADDAEIALLLSIRQQQVAEHARLCAQEEAQDRANLSARAKALANDPYDDSDDDSDENDHMVSCPDYEPQSKPKLSDESTAVGLILQAKSQQGNHLARMVLGLIPADYGLSPEMKARKVREAYDSDGEFIMLRLMPVPFSVFKEEVELLKAQGYVVYDVPDLGQIDYCPACGCNQRAGADYAPLSPKGRDMSKQRSFAICLSCFMVSEWVDVNYPDTTEKAIETHAEGRLTGERTNVQSVTSSAGTTASQPSSSTTADTLYTES